MIRLGIFALVVGCFAAHAQNPDALTNETVIRMVVSGVPTATVIKAIQVADAVAFRFLPGDLQQLSQYKVPDDVVKAMAAKSKAAASPTALVQTPTAPASTSKPAPTAVSTPPVQQATRTESLPARVEEQAPVGTEAKPRGSARTPKTTLTVRAVKHVSQVNERTATYTTPGTSNTNCSGDATTIGNTTWGNANCQGTYTPAQVHQNTFRTLEVMNAVEANGLRYIVTCTASVRWSNCAPMIDGDTFPAEIDGKTMWITAHKGGNQGKEVRVKYKILDIRPVPPAPTPDVP